MKIWLGLFCLLILCGCTNLQDSDDSIQSYDVQQLFIQEMGAFPPYPSIQDAVFDKDHVILSFYTEDSVSTVQRFYAEQLQEQGWNFNQEESDENIWVFDKPDKDWQSRTISTSVSIQITARDTKTYVEVTKSKFMKIQELPFK